MSIHYFAYGSNMLMERLLARCPSSEFVAKVNLPDARLTFDKVSKDLSGKCAFERASGVSLNGILWQVAVAEVDDLDLLEGVGHGYEPIKVKVFSNDSAWPGCRTYEATIRDPNLKPYEWYLALVVAGSIQNKMSPEKINALFSIEHIVDPDETRSTRLQALNDLEKAGYEGILSKLAKARSH